MSGLTLTGFVPKTLDEIQGEIEADEKTLIDPAIDVSPTSVLGQLNGIFAAREAALWQLAQSLYNINNPNANEGAALENTAALTGTKRIAAKPSFVTCTVNLNASTPLDAGSLINVAGQPDVIFETVDDVLSTTAGNYSVLCQSQALGPIVANAGTLTVITAPVLGWNSVTNPLDATLGAPQESDEDLRLRRVLELSAAGGSTLPAIRADILEIPGVAQCFVFENTTMVTDTNGLPAKSFEVVIYDGPSPAVDNQTMFDAVLAAKGDGIQVVGNITGTSIGSDGNSYFSAFSRATIRPVYLELDITEDDRIYAGDAAVKASIVAKGAQVLNLGIDVIALLFRSIPLSTVGVWDVTAIRLGFTSSPTGTANLSVGAREIAVLDTTRILLNKTNAPVP